MNSHESVKIRATQKGALDAFRCFEYNSKSLAGSLWDKYYKEGYEKTQNYINNGGKNQTIEDNNVIADLILKGV